MAQGLPAGGATVPMWVVKLAILGVLLYVAVWAALLLVALVVAARMAPQGDDDFLGRKAEELDHRESLFYHPASYNDDPDPRFEDD